MKKQILFLMMALLPMVASAYDVEVDGIYYNVIKKAKVAEVTHGDRRYVGVINIPSDFEKDGITYSVTSIGNSAFSYCESLLSVTIPNSVTSIGEYAFSRSENLTSVTIPNSVTSIGNSAFSYCESLLSVNIPSGVIIISGFVFCGCSSLTSVTIPSSVTTIENNAFAGCSGLRSVHITDIVAWCNIKYYDKIDGGQFEGTEKVPLASF